VSDVTKAPAKPAKPPSYLIRRVSDFLGVPAARRGACVQDMLQAIDEAEAVAVQCREKIHADEFLWVDDGRAEYRLTVGQQMFSVGGSDADMRSRNGTDEPPDGY